MKELLNELFAGKRLTRQEAKTLLLSIGNGEHDEFQIAALLSVLNFRFITVDELTGFREAMLEMCLAVDLSEFNAIDIVGTGGDGHDTFNISTLSSFVAAGAGIKVSKHGNYGMSSSSGSSNVLEALGVPFSNKEEDLKRMLDEAGFCMMHAPLFHPAMRHVGPVRKALKVRTIFNMLGPIVNPSRPKNQLLGVSSLELLRIYGYLFQNSSENFKVVFALDGYDEVSLTSPTKIISNGGEAQLNPADFGLRSLKQEELYGGGSVESAAKIFTNVLENTSTAPQKEVVLANAALAIQTVRPETSLSDAVSMAKESIESGKAKAVLTKLTDLKF